MTVQVNLDNFDQITELLYKPYSLLQESLAGLKPGAWIKVSGHGFEELFGSHDTEMQDMPE